MGLQDIAREITERLEKAAKVDHGKGKRMESVTVTRKDGSTYQRKQMVGTEKDDPKGRKKKAEDAPSGGKQAAAEATPDKKPEGAHIDEHAKNTDEEKLMRYVKSGSDEVLRRKAIVELRNRGINIDNEGNVRVKERKQSAGQAEWFKELAMEYKVKGVVPEDVDKASVQINFEDPHSGAFIKFRSSDGSLNSLYTEEYHARSSEIKYARIMKLGGTFLGDVAAGARGLMRSEDTKKVESGIVLSIIAQTGLRVGSKASKESTGNEGITTLTAGSISIKGDEISLDFIGKSNKRNTALITDRRLAELLGKLMEGKGISDPVFSVTGEDILETLRGDLGYDKEVKTKDLRTAMAAKIARESLFGQSPPPPMPKDKKQAEKLIAKRLRSCFETVAGKLNNTPAMAKNSYVPPQVIEAWMKANSAEAMLEKAMKDGKEEKARGIPSIEDIGKVVPPVASAEDDEKYDLPDDVDGDYPMPEWIEDLFEKYEPDYGLEPDEVDVSMYEDTEDNGEDKDDTKIEGKP